MKRALLAPSQVAGTRPLPLRRCRARPAVHHGLGGGDARPSGSGTPRARDAPEEATTALLQRAAR
ncbi:hypothetical protein MNEG_11465, partial [Monoraphidium neglectum]